MDFALTIAGLAALALICDYVLFFVKKDSNSDNTTTIFLHSILMQCTPLTNL